MIYDPITRQSVTLTGRYKPQTQAYKFGEAVTGSFRFVRVTGVSMPRILGEEERHKETLSVASPCCSLLD